MRAFVVTGRGVGGVQEVAPPVAGRGQVVVDVHRVGLCGTDVAMFSADDARLRHARTRFPLQLGHEWCGRVRTLGPDVDPAWSGRRVVGDTMIGCGVCERCRRGQHHICADRFEVGVRGGWPGALAEQLLLPATALRLLPPEVGDDAGALVEPGANAYRAVRASEAGPGTRLLVLGPGTIGLLAALFGRAAGAEVHVLGSDEPSLALARQLGPAGTWTAETLPALRWDAVIDATDGAGMPAFAAGAVEPGGRIVLIGISAEPSLVDTRALVRADVSVVGVLGGSAGLAATVAAYASGTVDPRPLVRAVVGLADVSEVLSGRGAAPGARPKVLVDPTQ